MAMRTRTLTFAFKTCMRLTMALSFTHFASDGAVAAAQPKSHGITVETAVVGGEALRVHLYRPRRCTGALGPLLLVFAGYERNAEDYLRRARRIARDHCLTILAPDLDQERFPRARYQRAGISHKQPGGDADACMGLLLRDLVGWARDHAGRPDAPIVLFGHSAGAQMLSRVMAYCPLPDTLRVVIANPSSYVAPSLIESAPFGFASTVDVRKREEQLARYLAQPITIYLGDADTGDDRLDKSRRAQRQGRTRLERGRNVFAAAQAMAAARRWEFGWRLVIAPGVGHSSRGMLQAPQMSEVLGKAEERGR